MNSAASNVSEHGLAAALARWPLRRAIPVAIFSVILTLGGLGYFLQYQGERALLLDLLQGAEREATRAAAIHVARHLHDGDHRALQLTAEVLGSEENYQSVAIIDAEMNIIAASDGAVPGSPLALERYPGLTPQQLHGQDPCHLLVDEQLVGAEPFVVDGRRGWVVSRRDISITLDALRRRLGWEAGQYTLAGLLTVGLFWWAFEVVFRRRVDRIKQGLKRANAGELGVRVPVSGQDELSEIMQAFNRTMGGLERGRAQLLLREQELRKGNAALSSLRRAVDEHAVVSATDSSGVIVYANEQCCAVSGYSHKELMGANHRIVRSDAYGPEFFSDMWGTIRSGHAWTGLLKNRRKDGRPYWLQCTLVPTRDEDGKIAQFISIGTDVTRREQLRQGLEMLASAEPGEKMLARLTEAISLGLEAKWVGVCRLQMDEASLQVVALWACGVQGPTFCMDLADTPCAATIYHPGVHVVPDNLVGEFTLPPMLVEQGAVSYRGHAIARDDGTPLGVVWAIDDKPVGEYAEDSILLALAARRAAAELERIDSTRELELQRERLSAVIEGAQLAVWDWDIRHDTLYFNERFATMLGYSPRELAPGPTAWSSLLHPDDFDMATSAVAAHRLGQTPVYMTEHRLRAKDGSWRWILDRGQVTQRDEHGVAIRMAGVHVDITERKTAELALREERARFELLVRSGNLGFWEWDLRADRTAVTSLVTDLMELSPGQQADIRQWLGLIHPDDNARFIAAGNAHLKGETPFFNMEARFRARAGWRWQLVTGQVVERDADNRAVRLMGTHVDVTELREAQATVQENEQRLQLLVDSARLGYWDLDLVSGEAYVNARLLEFIGEPAIDGTLPRGTWQAHVHPEDRRTLQQGLDGQGAGSAPNLVIELRLRAADGHWGWFLSSGQVAARDAAGRPIRAVGFLQDIAERREAAEQRERLERQLQQARKMDALGKLTGGIAHDFNNILASILGYTSLAQAQLQDMPEAGRLADYLSSVMTAGERARELVAKMLDFSRNAPREDLSAIDPAPLLQEVSRMMGAIIPSNIALKVELPTARLAALIDPSDLHQTLVNLIVNARDALDGQHGEIVVALREPRRIQGVCSACHGSVDDDYLVIEVDDTGSGMAPAVLAHIFDPFFTTKRSGKGTGMGLSVVHGIVHRCRGHVLVDSSVETGTQVHLLFPPAAPPVPARIAGVDATAPPRGNGERILLVDDEPLVVAFMAELFRLQGYAVDTARDGVEALELLRQAPQAYRLLLTDQTMPRMTGSELVLKLRDVCPDLPIVLCTGYSDSINEQRALALGIRRFLHKPLAPDALLAIVAEVLAEA